MDDLLQEFIAETREMLAAIAGELVAWEADPQDRAKLDAIFRFVHTVKGSCGFLDLPRLERLSHAAEDVLADLRADRRRPDAALVSAVLGVIDRIGELAEAIETGESLADSDDEQLIAALAIQMSHPPGDAASPAPAPRTAALSPRGLSRSIRLPIDLLDRMMSGVSDMVLARNELARKLRDHGTDSEVEAAFERMSASIAEMRDAITRTRMQRIDNIFTMLPRMVRDLSGDLGKLVMLEVDGGDVELDREMIEMIRDPLTHIIRNAIDHGIEPPDERRAVGKSAAGRLIVTAGQSGNQILIRISDDGRGIDGDALALRAVDAGAMAAARAASLSPKQKLDLIFEPGLSTAARITAVSGRGVGMDIVRANIERIGGVIDVESRYGQGLTLTLRVPLTLTIIPALTVAAAGQYFAIPRSSIEEIVRPGSAGVRLEQVGGRQVATIRGRKLPVARLDVLIGAPAAGDVSPILVVLKPAGYDGLALAVDAVLDHEELVVKPAAPAVMAAGLYAGTTLPDNGRPMLLLEPAGIAARGGIAPRVIIERVEDDVIEEKAEDAGVAALLFRDRDGVERAIRLSLVERIEELPAAAAAIRAGCARLVHEGRILPLFISGQDIGEATRFRALLLNDGQRRVAYAIGEVIDIVALPTQSIAAATSPGRIAGVVLFAGRQIELVDPHWLFAEAGNDNGADSPPLVLLCGGDAMWMRDVLQPLVEMAGYRVAGSEGAHGEPVDIVIMDDEDDAPPPIDAPLIRLSARRTGTGNSIYRYDRDAITEALHQCAEGREG